MSKYLLSETERAPLDEITAQIQVLMEQRAGMIVYAARLKGLVNSSLDYQGGCLIVTPQGGN